MSRYVTPRDGVHHLAMKPQPLPDDRPARAFAMWQSRDFLAVAYADPAGTRLSINRTQYDRRAQDWRDGITWDELMRVKRQCGFGDRWCVEVYPHDQHIVNVANMRHLWILDHRPEYAWRAE